MLGALLRRLHRLVRRSRFEGELEEEMRLHVELREERLRASGIPDESAHDIARRRFGNALRLREQSVDAWGWRWLEHVRHDTRVGWRSALRRPLSALTVAAMVAVGVAATTIAFSSVNAVFLKPLAARDPGRLRVVAWTSVRRDFAGRVFSQPVWDTRLAEGRRIESFAYAAFKRMRDDGGRFGDVACWTPGTTSVLLPGGRASVRLMSGNFFRVLGVDAERGRTLQPADDAPGAHVAVLSYRTWQRGFGGDPRILERTITIRGALFQIVGVMSPEFSGADPAVPPDIMVPYAALEVLSASAIDEDSWGRGSCRVIGRLAADVREEAARGAFEIVLRRYVADRWPQGDYDPPRAWLQPATATGEFQSLRTEVGLPLFALLAAVLGILAITCGNVAAFMLARGRARSAELTTRLALGASRAGLARMLLAEGGLVAGLGGAAGALAAIALTPATARLTAALTSRLDVIGIATPSALDVSADARVLAATLGLVLVVCCICGLLPAVVLARVPPAMVLKRGEGTRSSVGTAMTRGLVGMQVALGVVLLAGATVLGRSARNLDAVESGYDPTGVLFITLASSSTAVSIDQLLERARALPAATSVAVSQWPLFNNASQQRPVCAPDAGDRVVAADVEPATGDFFTTWGLVIRTGHAFISSEPVAIVNETLVQQLFGGADPIGARIRDGGCRGGERQIVGVVADHRDRQREAITPMVYYPYDTRVPTLPFTLSVRSTSRASTTTAMRTLVSDLGFEAQSDVESGEDYRERTIVRDRLLAGLLTTASLLALVTACFGVFATVAEATVRRLREIGIRIALGASRTEILSLVMRQSLGAVSLGVVSGAVMSFAAVRLMRGLLFDVEGLALGAPLISGAALMCAAALASMIPGWRAARMDPGVSLRPE